MADNPFAQFGGIPSPPPEQESDPFAQFGGKSVEQEDPFAQFGGQKQQVQEPQDTPLKDADLDRIAAKYGVDPAELKSIAPYYDAQVAPQSLGEAVTTGAKSAAGFAGRTAGLGIPQFIYKKLQEEPMRKAIDELRNIGQAQRSYLDVATEIATPGGAIGQAAKSTAGRLAGTAGTGTVMGLTESEEGKELPGAAIGTGLGLIFGSAAEGLGKYLASRGQKLTQAEEKLLAEPATRQIDLQKISNDAAQKYGKSEAVLEESTLGRLGRDMIDSPDVDAVLKEYYGDDLIKFLDASTEEGQAIRRGIGGSEATRRGVYDKLLDNALDKRAKDFAETLTDHRPATYEDAQKVIQEAQGRQGAEYIQSRYKDYVNTQNTIREIEEQGIRARGGVLDKPIEKVSGPQFVLREYDNRYGTQLEKGLSELSRDTNRLSYVKAAKRAELDNLFNEANLAGRDDALVNGAAIIKAIESGKVDMLDPVDQKLAQKVMQQFAATREFANETVKGAEKGRLQAMAIPKIDNYVSKLAVDIPEMVVRVESKIDDLKKQLSQTLGKEVNDLAQLSKQELAQASSSPELRDLISFISWKEGKQFNPKSGGELSGKLKEMLYTQDGNIALERIARSSLARSEATPMPRFIREQNLYKLIDRYNNDVLSTLYKRRGIDILRNEAQKLRKTGAEGQAAYVEKIIQDTLGTRKGTAAAVMNDIRREIARSLDSKIEGATNPVSKGALELIKSTPDMISFLGRQIYPNVLGWMNPRPIIQNMLSGIARTAPELGTEYGYTTYLRGVANAVMNFRKLSQEARNMGMVPEEFIRQGERALADGIRRSGVVDKSVGGYEKLARYGMALYQLSEQFNRASILGTAKIMANDLARNSKLAMSGLSRFPFEVRKEILANKTNPQKTYEIISKYLNDVTAFNYNRQSMFELGRELGPIFSTFAKWPTEVAGEAIYDMRSKGLIKGAGRMTERLLLPILALGAFDFLINEAGKDTDAYKKTVGQSGLKTASPGNAILGFTSGDIFTPPAVDALMKGIVTPITKGDVPKLVKGLDSLAFNYVPGAGLLKRITEDLATYIEGVRPSGQTTTERVLEGAERLSK